jgi:hypothetical protein
VTFRPAPEGSASLSRSFLLPQLNESRTKNARMRPRRSTQCWIGHKFSVQLWLLGHALTPGLLEDHLPGPQTLMRSCRARAFSRRRTIYPTTGAAP